MVVVVQAEGSRTLVVVSGEVDLAASPKLEQSLSGLPTDAGTVVVDLTDVVFLDSSGLSVLVQAHERLMSEDDKPVLRLVVSRSSILRTLEVTGLLGVLDVYGSREEAVAGR